MSSSNNSSTSSNLSDSELSSSSDENYTQDNSVLISHDKINNWLQNIQKI